MEDRLEELAGDGPRERRLLVRMDLSGLSGCSAVIDARLSLRIESIAADSLVLEVFEVDVPDAYPGWAEGTGGLSAGVSWLTVDGAAPWTTEGGDYVIAALDTQTVRADSVVTFALPGWLVLGWIQQPSSNDGVIVKAADASREHFALMHLRESGDPALRPRLDLLYFKSG